MSTTIEVRHNIEVAHRLSLLPGKCEAIHGHSMWVDMELAVDGVDAAGLAGGLDFGSVKRSFRSHLDSVYDHHLLLNHDDPIADYPLPGLARVSGDPSTENIARWIGEWAAEQWPSVVIGGLVRVRETSVNAATWRWSS